MTADDTRPNVCGVGTGGGELCWLPPGHKGAHDPDADDTRPDEGPDREALGGDNLAAQVAALGFPFPEPCSCTDPKGHRAECPSNPGELDIVIARVVPQPDREARNPILEGRPEWDGVCGVEHDPGRICMLPKDHPAPPAPAVPVTAPDETLRRAPDGPYWSLRDEVDAATGEPITDAVAALRYGSYVRYLRRCLDEERGRHDAEVRRLRAAALPSGTTEPPAPGEEGLRVEVAEPGGAL